MATAIPRLTSKITASLTAEEKRKFKAVARSKGSRPSTWLRELILSEIGSKS